MNERSAEGGATDLVTRTYERLRDLIVLGRLAPGSRIIEADLAARLGVSRTPVRGALHRLLQEGLVVAADTGRNTRLSVAPMTREDGRELLHVLGALEGLGAAWAAGLPGQELDRLVAEMRDLNGEMRRLLESGDPDPEAVFDLHSGFHRLLLQGIEAPRIRALHATIRPQVDRYRRIYISSVPTGGFSAELAEHEVILAALERRDAEAARAAVQGNWSAAAERLGRIITAVGNRGSW